MARTERKSERRKMTDLLVLRHQQRACRMAQTSAEKIEQTGFAKKEKVASVPQREQLASTLEPSLPKRKGTETSVHITKW